MKKQARVYDSPLLQSLVEEITPQEHEQTLNQMMMSARIEDGITARGWSKSEFAKRINQTPSTISKWLSGSHNFTLDTLTDIQRILGIQLLCLNDVEIIKDDVNIVFQPIVVGVQNRLNVKNVASRKANRKNTLIHA